MAKSTGSIAGRAHGAKPKSNEDQAAQYRPQLTDLPGVHPEVSRAIQTAFDNLYTLRSQVQALQAGSKANAAQSAAPSTGAGGSGSTGQPSSTTTTIAGINVRSPTDSSSLKDGYSLKYDAKSGEFVFSP